MLRRGGRINLPWLAVLDRRLHPNDRQVLAVICGHEDPVTHTSTVKRDDIAKLAGIHETKVSPATKRLEQFEWILKSGAGKGLTYHINWNNKPLATDAILATVTTDPTGSTDAKRATDPTDPTGSTDAMQAPVCSHQQPATDAKLAPVGSVETDRPTTIGTEDQIRSDSDDQISHNQIRSGSSQVVTFAFAVEALKRAGCPYSIKQDDPNNPNTLEVQQWVKDQIRIDTLIAAIEKAKTSPTRKTKLGPRYVSGCITTILHEQNQPEQIQIPSVHDHAALDKLAAKMGINTKGMADYQTLRKEIIRQADRRAA